MSISPQVTPRRIGRMQGQLDDISLTLGQLRDHAKLDSSNTEAQLALDTARNYILEALEQLELLQQQIRQYGG